MNESTRRYGEAQAPGRTEDLHLLTGRGRFTSDINRPAQAYGVFVRAPHAHAEIVSVDSAAARAMPGVLGVFTEKDLQAFGSIPCMMAPPGRDGQEPIKPPRHPLARGRIRHVGEPVALVVAESEAAALDAAEQVAVDYRVLPAVTDVEAAIAQDAPLLWPEAPGNIALDYADGDADAVEQAFAQATHVVRLKVVNNRLAVCTMEPRAAIAEFDEASGRYTLRTGSQGVTAMRDVLAKAILRIPPDKLRVVSGDVGGGFGMKTQPYPEYPPLLHAARALGRPVKWTASRSESFLADNQARDSVMDAALALDADYRFLALKVEALSNMGAYLSAAGLGIATRNMAWCMAGVYDTPAIRLEVKCLFTNTAPIGPYRGAGRPEASYIIERIVDQAAAELGIDRIELRRRNLIRPAAMPYHTPVTQIYDSGAFEEILDAARAMADWDGFPARRDDARKRGRYRGIGLACFIEHAGARLGESARIRFGADGIVTVYSAAQSQGQGHFTSFAQVVAERLGIPFEQVRIVEGDSDVVPNGGQTTGSRSMAVCGGAMMAACDKAIETGKAIAAHLLEASRAGRHLWRRQLPYRRHGQVAFPAVGRGGRRHRRLAGGGAAEPRHRPRLRGGRADLSERLPYLRGRDRSRDRPRHARALCRRGRRRPGDQPADRRRPDAWRRRPGRGPGARRALRLRGGLGPAVSGSFMDYTMPRADDMPSFDFEYHPVPCRTNPLGVKGAGESGTIGALPTVANAIMDALRQAGVEAFDMPATPTRIWSLLQKR